MKKILLALVALILVAIVSLGVLAFVSPADFKVERDVVINKPKSEVFDYLKMLKNQNEWGPWVQRDPNIKLSYSGNDGEVGFVSKWDSEHEQVGVGEQEIKKITDGERIDTEIRFIKPWESTTNGFMTTTDAGEGKTKVSWGFTGSMPRPWNLMLLFTPFEEEVAKDFDAGLAKLKSVLEKGPSPEKEESEDDAKDAEKKEDQEKE
ncbi:MAG: SRPBCC family protein [Pyrinomonadaceae bacterium]|nr:SRPBCC family protein [Pyrinomonadaceae bacterium]